MIEVGSPEHEQLRAGRITWSRFHTVMFGGAAAWNTLMNEIRNPKPWNDNAHVPALAWGREQEPRARAEYQIRGMVSVDLVTFMQHKELSFIGVSPDGIVRDFDSGGIEIKCPYNTVVHEQTVLHSKMPPEHMPQVQGFIWVAELEWCDFISYDPRAAQHIRYFEQRIYRDDKYIERLRTRCIQFWDLYSSGEKATREVKSSMLADLNF